jgi:hypothetical protein
VLVNLVRNTVADDPEARFYLLAPPEIANVSRKVRQLMGFDNSVLYSIVPVQLPPRLHSPIIKGSYVLNLRIEALIRN